MIRKHPWLLPLLLAVMVLGGWYYGYRAKAGDRELPVYVTGGARMAVGEEIYRGGEDDKPFTYPPFAAVPFVPFAKLPASWQAPAWFEVNFLLLLAILVVLHRFGTRKVSGAGPPKVVWFWVLTLAMGVHHVFSVFSNQSHDLFVAGALALIAVSWGRRGIVGSALAGLGAGLGGAFKATPLIFLGLFGLRLRFAAVIVTALAFVGLSLLPDWLFPRADGGSWLQAWLDVVFKLDVGGTANVEGIWGAHSFLNQSLSGTTTRLFSEPAVDGTFVEHGVVLADLGSAGVKAVTIVTFVLVLGLLTLAAFAGRRALRTGEHPAQTARLVAMGEVAAFACGMLLLSPQSSKAHFCVWLFPAAFLADRLLRGPRDRWLWPLVIAALVCGPLASKGIVGRELGNRLLAYGNVTWCTVLLLLAVVRALWTTSRRT